MEAQCRLQDHRNRTRSVSRDQPVLLGGAGVEGADERPLPIYAWPDHAGAVVVWL